jgi:hypothetical protein
VGKGTTFTIYLPASVERQASPAETATAVLPWGRMKDEG